MKLIIMPKSINMLNNLLDKIDGVIVGYKGLCMNMPKDYSKEEIEDIIKICKDNNKEVFISLNKNMFNKDIDTLKEVMISLDNMGVNGILYYDIALVNIKEELGLKVDLVWNQEHLTTNYLTMNFWYEYGAKYTLISNEITLDEIKDIKKNAKCKLMFYAFGYLPMFVSRRNLVKNYLETFNIDDNSKINYLSKEGKEYQIIDTEDGTIAYSDRVLNAIKESIEIDADYTILNSFSIDEDIFNKVVDLFSKVSTDNALEYKEEIDKMLPTYLGFLYNETIYKVKKND